MSDPWWQNSGRPLLHSYHRQICISVLRFAFTRFSPIHGEGVRRYQDDVTQSSTGILFGVRWRSEEDSGPWSGHSISPGPRLGWPSSSSSSTRARFWLLRVRRAKILTSLLLCLIGDRKRAKEAARDSSLARRNGTCLAICGVLGVGTEPWTNRWTSASGSPRSFNIPKVGTCTQSSCITIIIIIVVVVVVVVAGAVLVFFVSLVSLGAAEYGWRF